MIRYHGTPISGGNENARMFLRGRHALVSFAYPEQLAVCQEVAETYVLDNGAFSIWRKGGKLNVGEYIKWAEKAADHPRFNWALIPDIIDGKEKDNNILIDEWPRNEIPGVPIWHLDETLGKLEFLAGEWHTIALGSSGSYSNPGTQKWWNRMAQAIVQGPSR